MYVGSILIVWSAESPFLPGGGTIAHTGSVQPLGVSARNKTERPSTSRVVHSVYGCVFVLRALFIFGASFAYAVPGGVSLETVVFQPGRVHRGHRPHRTPARNDDEEDGEKRTPRKACGKQRGADGGKVRLPGDWAQWWTLGSGAAALADILREAVWILVEIPREPTQCFRKCVPLARPLKRGWFARVSSPCPLGNLSKTRPRRWSLQSPQAMQHFVAGDIGQSMSSGPSTPHLYVVCASPMGRSEPVPNLEGHPDRRPRPL